MAIVLAALLSTVQRLAMATSAGVIPSGPTLQHDRDGVILQVVEHRRGNSGRRQQPAPGAPARGRHQVDGEEQRGAEKRR